MKSQRCFYGQAIAVLVLAVIMPGPCMAQEEGRFSAEVRPGVNFPTRDAADSDLKTGVGLEGVVAYRFLEHFGVYAGWGWNRFSSRESFAGPDVTFLETGYTYGLQFMHGLGQSNVSLLARAGILSNHIEIEDDGGDVIGDSGKGFREGIGWQIETRVDWPLAPRWSLIPSLRYRSLPREIRLGAADTEVVLSYFSLGVGISRTF